MSHDNDTYPQEVHWICPQQNAAQKEKKRALCSSRLPEHQSPISTKVFDSPAAFIETNFNLILPNVQEDWQKRVSSLLFCLEKLDDVLVTVLSGQVQWSFSISVCWLQVYTAL